LQDVRCDPRKANSGSQEEKRAVLSHCSHGTILGTRCPRCDDMRRAIEGDDADTFAPEPTLDEINLRRESRWPEFLRPGAERR